MTQNSNATNEIFVPSSQLELIVTLSSSGIELYSSEALKQRFIKALYKNPKSRKHIKALEKLVNDGIVNVVSYNAKLLSYLKTKMKGSPRQRSMWGVTYKRKIYIMLDPMSNIFGFASNKTIIEDVMFHELVHFCVDINNIKFLKVSGKYLESFYETYFTTLFRLKSEESKKVDFAKFIAHIYYKYELKESVNWKEYHEFLDKLLKDAALKSGMSEKYYNETLDFYIKYGAYMLDPKTNSLATFSRYYRDPVIQSFYYAYDRTFGIKRTDIDSIIYQEIIFPSEVMAIAVTRGRSDILKQLLTILF